MGKKKPSKSRKSPSQKPIKTVLNEKSTDEKEFKKRLSPWVFLIKNGISPEIHLIYTFIAHGIILLVIFSVFYGVDFANNYYFNGQNQFCNGLVLLAHFWLITIAILYLLKSFSEEFKEIIIEILNNVITIIIELGFNKNDKEIDSESIEHISSDNPESLEKLSDESK